MTKIAEISNKKSEKKVIFKIREANVLKTFVYLNFEKQIFFDFLFEISAILVIFGHFGQMKRPTLATQCSKSENSFW